MKTWVLKYWGDKTQKDSVERWLDSLAEQELRSVTKEVRMLQLLGNELKMPHSKSLSGGLFELRERRYGFRIYYGFHGKQIIILLAAGDKNTQNKDIKKARKRLEEL